MFVLLSDSGLGQRGKRAGELPKRLACFYTYTRVRAWSWPQLDEFRANIEGAVTHPGAERFYQHPEVFPLVTMCLPPCT